MPTIEKNPFETISPEAAGIPSGAVTAFLDRLLEHRLNLHSLLIIRHGKMAAEGYWPPYDKDRKHRLYSASKSFASLAVGRMMDEGRIKLSDRIVDFFPEYLPEKVHPWMEMSTIRDMLTMADCHAQPTHRFGQPDWVASWFDTAPNHIPGTIFQYTSMASNLLCAIIEKLSGMKFLTYMRPVFDEIGVSEDIWCVETPEGNSFGGSGVIATPRDFAKTVLLCMNKGRHNGRQLISEAYIDAATSKQIDTYVMVGGTHDIDHQLGYGYQIWLSRENGFAFAGMGGQLALALPDEELLLVTTGDTQGTAPDTQEIRSAFFDLIYKNLSSVPLPENRAAYALLSEKLNNLKPMTVDGGVTSPISAEINGAEYIMEDNHAGITKLRFEFTGDTGSFNYTNKTGDHSIRFGFGKQIQGVFPETHYSGPRIATPKNAGHEIHTSAAWRGDRTLIVECFVTDDYLGSLQINAAFTPGHVTLVFVKYAENFLDEYQGYAVGRMK